MKKRKNLFPDWVSLKIILFSFILVALAVIYVFGIQSPVKSDSVLHIERGASVSSIATQLKSQDIINSPYLFKLAVRLHGGRVQSGKYDIYSGISVWRVAHKLSRGEISTTTVIIPEGLTVRQIKRLLENTKSLTGPTDCTSDAPVCDLQDGDIFPDTYRVADGTSRLALLELARKKMSDIESAWDKAGRIMPSPLKTWNDVITLASIVQKETPRASEMPVVASVYINRLRQNMRLQADPTVVYALTDGLGDMQGAPLLRGHLKIDSPYNTYAHRGLPPAPIANVGQAAIRAVLRPADTNYLFFVADGQGGHRFSNTYEEHIKNHADWREIKKIRNSK